VSNPPAQPAYAVVTRALRAAYDRMADERENAEVAPWKAEERWRFLALLQAEGKSILLEIGAGTGVHGKFFHDQGLDVTATDLSPEMVRLCRAKGLTAYEMDFLHLDFPPTSFDALYAMNCLLHVPRRELSQVLAALRDLLKPGGLFYLGQYGGFAHEGPWPEDHYEPKRFFSYLPDEDMLQVTGQFFDLVDFRRIPLEDSSRGHVQALILRRPVE
jgi:SAM-dependent methyltransferase